MQVCSQIHINKKKIPDRTVLELNRKADVSVSNWLDMYVQRGGPYLFEKCFKLISLSNLFVSCLKKRNQSQILEAKHWLHLSHKVNESMSSKDLLSSKWVGCSLSFGHAKHWALFIPISSNTTTWVSLTVFLRPTSFINHSGSIKYRSLVICTYLSKEIECCCRPR